VVLAVDFFAVVLHAVDALDAMNVIPQAHIVAHLEVVAKVAHVEKNVVVKNKMNRQQTESFYQIENPKDFYRCLRPFQIIVLILLLSNQLFLYKNNKTNA